MDDWPGLRTALTPQRAEELLVQHSRILKWQWKHPVRSLQLAGRCSGCLEKPPCYQERWARAELRRPR